MADYKIKDFFFYQIIVVVFLCSVSQSLAVGVGKDSIEKRMLAEIKTWDGQRTFPDKRCHQRDLYSVYLIDNFEQNVPVIPELKTSHGELLRRIIISGRDDITIRVINTSLSKGLALVLAYLQSGECADAVVSSIPGSNYSYGQLNTILQTPDPISPRNVLRFRKPLLNQIKSFALEGYPSVSWFDQLDANAAKLMNDSIKLNFIEAIAKYSVPVILPYGNVDSLYEGESRNVNLLSLSLGAKVYSGADQNRQPLPDYPHSILSSGRSKAVFNIRECPHPTNSFYALLDINEDEIFDYTFKRDNVIAFYQNGQMQYAPPVIDDERFEQYFAAINDSSDCKFDSAVVFTDRQYEKLATVCTSLPPKDKGKYHWFRDADEASLVNFDAVCRNRGKLFGTSFIPPNLVKQILPYNR